MSKPVVVDVEASGLGRGSYPIEVGFALQDESTHCKLIRPSRDWKHWDDSAEALHGISRTLLKQRGEDARKVVQFLNHYLAGQTVYSDAWGNDSSWLHRLADSAQLSLHFRLESIRSIIDEQQLQYWLPARRKVLERLALKRHRASTDALVIQQTYLLSRKMANARQTSGS